MKFEDCRRCLHMSYGSRGEPDYGKMRCMMDVGEGQNCVAFAPRRIRNAAPCKTCKEKDVPACRGYCPEWAFFVEENARRAYERTEGVNADCFLHEGIRRRVKARGTK